MYKQEIWENIFFLPLWDNFKVKEGSNNDILLRVQHILGEF